MLSKRETPPFPKWIKQLAAEVNTRRELREVKKIETADDLLSQIKKNES
jgi:hypothetical protein